MNNHKKVWKDAKSMFQLGIVILSLTLSLSDHKVPNTHPVIHLPLDMCPYPTPQWILTKILSTYYIVCASPWYPHLVHAGVSRTSCESRHWWLWHSTDLYATHNYNHGVLIYASAKTSGVPRLFGVDSKGEEICCDNIIFRKRLCFILI